MKHAKLIGDSFFAWDGDILVVNILSTPNAPRDEIGTPKGNQLRVSVTARAVRGRATDHMLRFLAPHFGVKPEDIEVVFGRMNINKQLRIKSPSRLPGVFSRQASAEGHSQGPGGKDEQWKFAWFPEATVDLDVVMEGEWRQWKPELLRGNSQRRSSSNGFDNTVYREEPLTDLYQNQCYR